MKKLRRIWLHWIGRANFKPKNYHRVCSKHFIGGKKTCLHNLPAQEQHINSSRFLFVLLLHVGIQQVVPFPLY